MTKASQGRILIAGAGVAGLSAALELAARGWEIEVFEKATSLSEVGAGLQLAPNAMQHLARLGVADQLLKLSVEPEALYLVDGASSRPLLAMELKEQATKRWHHPYIVCHRADLQAVLYDACKGKPNISIYLGAEVTKQIPEDSGLKVEVTSGDTIRDIHCDYLLCCDGVWSKQRQQSRLKSAEFSGYIAWRTTIATDLVPQSFRNALPNSAAVSAWLGKQAHFIAYPVKSCKAFNFVAITEGANPGESWSRVGDNAKLQSFYGSWSASVRDVLTSSSEWTYWPLFQMPDAQFVTSERVIFLGDASHAVTPFAAQGAAMAIEDAAALAEALSASDRKTALGRYDHIRKLRLAAVAKRGAMNRFAYHATGIFAFGRNMLFSMRNSESFLKDLDWLYGYDAVKAVRTEV